MKVAIFSTGDIADMKGVMNFVHEKVRRFTLCGNNNLQVEFFFLVNKYTGILGFFLRNRNSAYYDGQVVINGGIKYNIIVRECGILSTFSNLLFGNLISMSFARKLLEKTKDCNWISAHQLPCIYSSMLVKKISGKPYFATWHGSDINVTPFTSRRFFKATKRVIENADMNFFVSKALLNVSNRITKYGNKRHLYTGPSSIFYKYSDDMRNELRQKYGVSNYKVVVFAGNIIHIKNVLLLPDIFIKTKQKSPNLNLFFWIIGNGELERLLREKLSQANINFKMFGKVSPTEMPDIMNCSDVLVLPSLNEGFPLVVLEAISCGCNVVGSKVGGIPESAGENNTFSLSDDFSDKISDRICQLLENNIHPSAIDPEMSWESAVNIELQIAKNVLKV